MQKIRLIELTKTNIDKAHYESRKTLKGLNNIATHNRAFMANIAFIKGFVTVEINSKKLEAQKFKRQQI